MEDGSLRWGKAIYLGWVIAVSRMDSSCGDLELDVETMQHASSVVVDAKVEDEIDSIVPHDSQDQKSRSIHQKR